MDFRTSPPIAGASIPAGRLVTLGLTALLIIGYASWETSSQYDRTNVYPQEVRELGLPHIIGRGLTITRSLALFSGKELPPIGGSQLSALAGSFLLFLIVGPTMFAFAIRRRLLHSSREIPGLMTVLGLTTGASWMVLIIPLVFFQSTLADRLQNSMERQQALDGLVRDLFEVRIAALEYSALPRSVGGGEGDFRGFRIPSHLLSTKYATLSASPTDSSLLLKATLAVSPRPRYGSTESVPEGRIQASLDLTGKLYNWTYEGIFKW